MHAQAHEQPERSLPDPVICRAAPVTEQLAECLVFKPYVCEYAMPFGYGFLCGHPDRHTIIEGTRSVQMEKGKTNVSCEAKN